MRQFNTLTGFLLSKSTSPTTSDTVQFQGYAAIGDGGGAVWQHNGVTGQTVSQSPAQLADALLNDASGNQWALVDTIVNVKTLGALGDGATDDSGAFQAAINKVTPANGGIIIVPAVLTAGYVIETALLITYFHQDGATAAPQSASNKRIYLSLTMKGTTQGSSSRSVHATNIGATLINKTSGEMISVKGPTDGTVFESLRFVNDTSTQVDSVINIIGYVAIETGRDITFNGCTFIDERTDTGAFVALSERKGIEFNRCSFVKGGVAVRLGRNSSDSTGQLVTGQVFRASFKNTTFAGDIEVRRCRTLTFDECEFFPNSDGGGESAKIYLTGDAECSDVEFRGTKAMSDGDGTGVFCDLSSENTRGGLIVDGGEFGSHLTAFITPAIGAVNIKSTRFSQTASNANDVIITDGVGVVNISANHVATIGAGNQAVVDDRTEPLLPFVSHQELQSQYAFSTNDWETITTETVNLRGGLVRVSYAATITNTTADDLEFAVRVRADTEDVVAWHRSTIPTGGRLCFTCSRVVSGVTKFGSTVITLQARQINISSPVAYGDVKADSFSNTFLTYEEI